MKNKKDMCEAEAIGEGEAKLLVYWDCLHCSATSYTHTHTNICPNIQPHTYTFWNVPALQRILSLAFQRLLY